MSAAAEYHDHARYMAQGLIELFGSRLFETPLQMTSERPSGDRIVFRGTRAG